MDRFRIVLILVVLFVITSFTGCSNKAVNINQIFPEYDSENMKIFYIKEKFWTLRDSFTIKDRSKEPVFKVKGKFISIGDSLKLLSMEGEELLKIRERVISFTPRYYFLKNGKRIAKMVKIIKLFTDKYYIQVDEGSRYIVKGKFADHRYSIYKDGKRVAYISRKWFKWTEHYTVVIVPEEDERLLLSSVIVIDMVNKDKARAND